MSTFSPTEWKYTIFHSLPPAFTRIYYSNWLAFSRNIYARMRDETDNILLQAPG